MPLLYRIGHSCACLLLFLFITSVCGQQRGLKQNNTILSKGGNRNGTSCPEAGKVSLPACAAAVVKDVLRHTKQLSSTLESSLDEHYDLVTTTVRNALQQCGLETSAGFRVSKSQAPVKIAY